MREVYWIRHAQSTANAGGRTDSTQAIVLSPAGEEQAREFARHWSIRPGMIVVSAYVRTHQTAIHIKRKFEGVPVEEWPVHEFTYLSRAMGSGTTAAERMKLAVPYWEAMDPFANLGEGSESYAEFHTRIAAAISRAAAFRGVGPLMIFCHNRVLCQLIQVITNPPHDVHEGMRRMHGMCTVGKFEIPNCGVLRMTVDDQDRLTLGRVSVVPQASH